MTQIASTATPDLDALRADFAEVPALFCERDHHVDNVIELCSKSVPGSEGTRNDEKPRWADPVMLNRSEASRAKRMFMSGAVVLSGRLRPGNFATLKMTVELAP